MAGPQAPPPSNPRKFHAEPAEASRPTALLALAVLFPTLSWGATASIREMEQQGDRVPVHYDLTAEGPVTVHLAGSSDGGSTFTVRLSAVSGDTDCRVVPGTGK